MFGESRICHHVHHHQTTLFSTFRSPGKRASLSYHPKLTSNFRLDLCLESPQSQSKATTLLLPLPPSKYPQPAREILRTQHWRNLPSQWGIRRLPPPPSLFLPGLTRKGGEELLRFRARILGEVGVLEDLCGGRAGGRVEREEGRHEAETGIGEIGK